ncbi:MAG: hypothetical protein KBA03_02815 [Anaerolineaceae bacterium]|nr:hypothetical protein [Anaerolineaceae bacterium]
MKKNTQILFAFALIFVLTVLPILTQEAKAQWVDPPANTQPTAVPWNYVPDNGDVVHPYGWVDPITVQQVVNRPLLSVAEYFTGENSTKSVNPYGNFELNFRLKNNGERDARNIVMTFSSTDFDPLDGSVITMLELKQKSSEWVKHQFKVNDMSTWKYSGQITAVVNYWDEAGVENSYTETLTFSIGINQSGALQATAVPTQAPADQAQMVVHSYESDVDPLEPGTSFKLKLKVGNDGNQLARNVSLVYGGSSLTTNSEGTPVSGVSGGEADNAVFAPIGKSNVVLLGDVQAGTELSPEQDFIVNVTATPGAYPLKLSFIYTDAKGNRVIDDQVITLLIYSLPQLEISFYMPVEGMLSAGEMGSLPIQITNLARKSVVLGNVKVSSPNGEMTNNTSLVGSLDPGGYYTIDPMFTPNEEGTATINLEIRYTDDFNQLRTYNSSLEVEVGPAFEMPTPYPELDENGNPVLDENGNPIMIDPMNPDLEPELPVDEPGFFAKIWNAIKGFFGFSSNNDSQNMDDMYNDFGN